jgi:CRP-like cAMP-binding protein
MAKDSRQLREEAAVAVAAGKHKRAIECYLELERLESRDPQWPKRAGESYRKLGKQKEAIAAFERAAERYMQGGFMVQAIAVCKLILQIEPENSDATRRLASINESQGQGQTRIGALADNHPSLAANTAVAALRERSQTTPPPDVAHLVGDRPRPGTAADIAPIDLGLDLSPAAEPPPAVGRRRTGTGIPPMRPGAPIVDVSLGDVIDGVRDNNADGSTPGVRLVPLEDERPVPVAPPVGRRAPSLAAQAAPARVAAAPATYDLSGFADDPSNIQIDVEALAADADDDEPMELDAADIEDPEELQLDDIEEIPLAAPKQVSSAARKALNDTPLLAGLSPDALEALIERIELVSVPKGEVLFREGDLGDALYIISEGLVAVQTEGPPRVEIGRLAEGAFFGEVALVTDQPRSATVATLMPTELLRIDREILASLLADYPEVLKVVLRFVRDRLVERLVLTSPLFRPFDDAERRALAARFKFLEIERGATIIPGGSKADGLYILLAGRLGTRRSTGPELFGPGDLIGEGSLLAGEKFEQPVEAIGKALALCLPAAEFRELIMTHPHVLEYVGEQAEARRKVAML